MPVHCKIHRNPGSPFDTPGGRNGSAAEKRWIWFFVEGKGGLRNCYSKIGRASKSVQVRPGLDAVP